MKRLIHLKITCLFLLIVTTSCNKEECKYDGGCTETEPEGFMVTTMSEGFMGSSPNVATIYKTTFNGSAPVGGDWNNPGLGAGQVGTIATPNWNVATIGQVFGIALDNSNNIYLAATDIYKYDLLFSTTTFGPGGSAGIYKTNVGTTGTTTTLVTTVTSNAWNYALTNKIPNSGVGIGNSIGNIAFDKTNNQLFVTNLEDGRIYRLDATTGNVKSVFDPFTLDAPLNGMVAVGERIWGVGVLTQGGITEVYFARTETALINSIWSIRLNAAGEFIATPEAGQPNVFNDSASSSNQEIRDVGGTQNKISDIEFSCSGKMLIAERGDPHASKISEYKKVGATWIITNPFYTGGIGGNNSAGGVDYGSRETGGVFIKDDIVWASQNYGTPVNNSYLSYGVQGISSSGNTATTNGATDLFIDANQSTNYKRSIGDVDVFDSSCPCNDVNKNNAAKGRN